MAMLRVSGSSSSGLARLDLAGKMPASGCVIIITALLFGVGGPSRANPLDRPTTRKWCDLVAGDAAATEVMCLQHLAVNESTLCGTEM
jgi:hypothetical protein